MFIHIDTEHLSLDAGQVLLRTGLFGQVFDRSLRQAQTQDRPPHRPGELCHRREQEQQGPPPSPALIKRRLQQAGSSCSYPALCQPFGGDAPTPVLLNTIFSYCVLIVHDEKQRQEPEEKSPFLWQNCANYTIINEELTRITGGHRASRLTTLAGGGGEQQSG